MRWLFLFVLSLNLAYVVWELNRSSVTALTTVQSIKGVPAIQLLAELPHPEKPAQQQERVAVDDQPPGQLAAGALSSGESSGKSSAGNGISDKKLKVSAGSKAETEFTGTPMKMEALKPDVAADTAADRLQAGRQQTAEELTAKKPEEDACYTLGPFRDLDELRILTRELKEYVVSADFRGREETEQSLHWVNIKPAANRAAALATGERLKQKKIKDFYIIREGENINGISLGYYRNKDGAEGLTRKVRKLGFDVVLEPVFKTYTVYWLDYQLAPGTEVPEAIFNKHIKAAKKDQVTHVSRECS